MPRRGGGRGRGRGGRYHYYPCGEPLRRPTGPPCGQPPPPRPPSFSDLRGPLPQPVWFAPASHPSLQRMHRFLFGREAEGRHRAVLKREADRHADELRSDEGNFQPLRSSTPDRNQQLWGSSAADEVLDSPRSPSPSVASGSVASGPVASGPASGSHSARTQLHGLLGLELAFAHGGTKLLLRRSARTAETPNPSVGINIRKYLALSLSFSLSAPPNIYCLYLYLIYIFFFLLQICR